MLEILLELLEKKLKVTKIDNEGNVELRLEPKYFTKDTPEPYKTEPFKLSRKEFENKVFKYDSSNEHHKSSNKTYKDKQYKADKLFHKLGIDKLPIKQKVKAIDKFIDEFNNTNVHQSEEKWGSILKNHLYLAYNNAVLESKGLNKVKEGDKIEFNKKKYDLQGDRDVSDFFIKDNGADDKKGYITVGYYTKNGKKNTLQVDVNDITNVIDNKGQKWVNYLDE